MENLTKVYKIIHGIEKMDREKIFFSPLSTKDYQGSGKEADYKEI